MLPLHRYLPVKIYGLATSKKWREIWRGISFTRPPTLIHHEGFRRLFEIHSVGPSESGSFRITFVLRSLERLTLQGVHEVLEGIKVACESFLKTPGEEDKPAILIDAQTEVAKAQTKLANAQAEGAIKLTEAEIKLANAQADLAKVKTYLAVAGFFVATLGAGVAGYIQWAHLQAEKQTPGSTLSMCITPASLAFTGPHNQTSPGTPSAGRQVI